MNKQITYSKLSHVTDIKVQKFEQFKVIDVWYEKSDSTHFEEIIHKFYECSRADASRVTNTNDYYRAPFEGETVIIMIILELGGTRPSRNKLQGLLAVCGRHSTIGSFDRCVSQCFMRQRAPLQLPVSAISYRR